MKYLNSVCEKLKEADFFLEKIIEAERNVNEQNYYFSAFSSASRSVTFVIQYVASGIDGFEQWYEAVRTRQKDDKIAKYLLEARNEALKIGSQPISFGQVVTLPGGEEKLLNFFAYVGSEPPADVPILDVVSTCKYQMRNLVAIVAEFFERFEASAWDEARERNEMLSQITQLRPIINGGDTPDDLWQKIVATLGSPSFPIPRPSDAILPLRQKYGLEKTGKSGSDHA